MVLKEMRALTSKQEERETLHEMLRLDWALVSFRSAPSPLETVHDARCDACLKVRHNLLTDGTFKICLDCHHVIPERHACGNTNSSRPQGEMDYKGTGRQFVKRFPTRT